VRRSRTALQLVHMERAVADYGRDAPKDYAGYQPGLFSRDPRDPAYSETGVFGDRREGPEGPRDPDRGVAEGAEEVFGSEPRALMKLERR